MLLRIPSDYLRQKILEKRVWYIGDSMFQAVQWTSSASTTSPPLESIQIWAHLKGIPLDLRHLDGYSLIAGLVGEPKETDDFMLNLVSFTVSHVKVAVDLTKPLPSTVEYTRESGEVVEVLVTYPWVPPTCSHCKELGHIMKNCLLLPVPPKQYPVDSKGKGPVTNERVAKQQSSSDPVEDHTAVHPSSSTEKGSSSSSAPPSSTMPSSTTTFPPVPPKPPSPPLPVPPSTKPFATTTIPPVPPSPQKNLTINNQFLHISPTLKAIF